VNFHFLVVAALLISSSAVGVRAIFFASFFFPETASLLKSFVFLRCGVAPCKGRKLDEIYPGLSFLICSTNCCSLLGGFVKNVAGWTSGGAVIIPCMSLLKRQKMVGRFQGFVLNLF